ncbi:MAG: ribosomal protein S18-alanine N-acetyltransferase [Minwuia sp.]|nr:ribosomal protein S18-alanine N-acetyltransferase [Minwuia sp.]
MKPVTEVVGIAAAELLAELHARSVPKPWDARAFADLLAMPGAFALIAGSHEPVGFILMRQVADEAEVIMVAVAPLARRQGIARVLLDDAIRQLQGIAQVFLEVATDNSAAIALYEGAGFGKVGVRRDYYTDAAGQKTDALVMRLTPALPCREPD